MHLFAFFFFTFASDLNLLHLHRFAQLCFLRNESSLALAANASKHEAETSIWSVV